MKRLSWIMADEVSQEEKETTEPWQQNKSQSARKRSVNLRRIFSLSSIPPKKTNIFYISILALASKKWSNKNLEALHCFCGFNVVGSNLDPWPVFNCFGPVCSGNSKKIQRFLGTFLVSDYKKILPCTQGALEWWKAKNSQSTLKATLCRYSSIVDTFFYLYHQGHQDR